MVSSSGAAKSGGAEEEADETWGDWD